jgi:hypothetical protein
VLLRVWSWNDVALEEDRKFKQRSCVDAVALKQDDDVRVQRV